ncbi:MAG: NAD(P)H-dependent flavin oxidoreductase [Pleomorphochaeta sp.]
MKTFNFDNMVISLKQFTKTVEKSIPVKEIIKQIEFNNINKKKLPQLKIGNHIASLPIVQGGMGVGISLSSLASAVANEGGVGVIAANGIGLLDNDYYKDGDAASVRAFRKEIQIARKKTKGIIGVNIMVAIDNFKKMLDVAIEEAVDVVFMGAGLPIKNIPVKKMREKNIAIVPIVSSARATNLIFKMWSKIYNDIPDGVVLEGPLAGGHLGYEKDQLDKKEYQLNHLVKEIKITLDVYKKEFKRELALIAGGGVYTGRDIYETLNSGADAVQMATRFVATDECDADIRFKEAYVNCKKSDIGLIKSPVGMVGRAIRNDFIRKSEEGIKHNFNCSWKCLSTCKANEANYCISVALNNARKGQIDKGFVFAGSSAYRIKEIVSVKALVSELKKGYLKAKNVEVNKSLNQLLSKIQSLYDSYQDRLKIEYRCKKAYEKALVSFNDVAIEEVRKQYKKAKANVINTQLLLEEKLLLTWKIALS